MITAVDTSVLVAMTKPEPTANAWFKALSAASAEGQLVASEIVVAEMVAYTRSENGVRELLERMEIRFDPAGYDSAVLAGEIFRAYRDRGGPRERILPDFMVAAHASTQAGRLATADRGYIRNYFPRLKLLTV